MKFFLEKIRAFFMLFKLNTGFKGFITSFIYRKRYSLSRIFFKKSKIFLYESKISTLFSRLKPYIIETHYSREKGDDDETDDDSHDCNDDGLQERDEFFNGISEFSYV